MKHVKDFDIAIGPRPHSEPHGKRDRVREEPAPDALPLLAVIGGTRYASGMVAYRESDSTSFRYLVDILSQSEAEIAQRGHGAGDPDNIDFCGEIAHASAMHWSRPYRRPTAEDSLDVWQRARASTDVGGISFMIDDSHDRGPASGIFAMFVGEVTFARGRGRLDMVRRTDAPAIWVAGSVFASPQAKPGEYYLFDSTGFALVRPGSKTYSTYSLASASYNFEERRDGWPPWFDISKPKIDSLGDASDVTATKQRRTIPLYWHLDLESSPAIRVLSRGRMTVNDIPPGEVSVVRWFGPAQSLANIPGGATSLIGASLRITTVAELPKEASDSATTDLVVLHSLTGLRGCDSMPARLTVPNDYIETVRPDIGSARSSHSSPRDADRWKQSP